MKFWVLVPSFLFVGCQKGSELSFLTLWEKTIQTFWNRGIEMVRLLNNIMPPVRTAKSGDQWELRKLAGPVKTDKLLLSTLASLLYSTLYLPWYVSYHVLRVANDNHDNGAPPLIWNHAKTWWGLRRHWQKIYRQIAVVSAHWFNTTAKKKHRYSLKNIPYVPMHAGQRHEE